MNAEMEREAGKKRKWFVLAPNPDAENSSSGMEGLEDFKVCEACYEDEILAQPPAYSSQLIPAGIPIPGGGKTGTNYPGCTMSIPYIQRIYRDLPPKAIPFPTFLSESKARLSMLRCQKGKPLNTWDNRFFSPKPEHGFSEGQTPEFCLSCYTDLFNLTSFASRFLELDLSIREQQKENAAKAKDGTMTTLDKLMLDIAVSQAQTSGPVRKCIMGTPSIVFPISRAVESSDHSHYFWTVVPKVLCHPKCEASGIEAGGTWWVLASNPSANFSICGGCFEGTVKAFPTTGIEAHFTPKPDIPKSTALICSLNPESGRALGYYTYLFTSINTSSISHLSNYVSQLPSFPCLGAKPFMAHQEVTSKWYGWDPYLSICEECWLSFVVSEDNVPSPSILSSISTTPMNFNGEQKTDKRLCSLYSDRMRRLWRIATGQRDVPHLPLLPPTPEETAVHDFPSFLTFAQSRYQTLLASFRALDQFQVDLRQETARLKFQGSMALSQKVSASNYAHAMGPTGSWSNSYLGHGNSFANPELLNAETMLQMNCDGHAAHTLRAQERAQRGDAIVALISSVE
ncbi:hypothetical protein MKZ38_005187 [Zalerion maritima]|uniref:Uncharacterized protein n=1 Tax=Zalerion maritima TaxID=339359 RepID=A0AAD5RW64_9PEZI|nr:hypothetical protein MKZ38_005187 [Zalerion maritima]